MWPYITGSYGDNFTAMTKVYVDFKRQNLLCYPSTQHWMTKYTHSVFPGSDLFDFKIYLLITYTYNVLKNVCSWQMGVFLQFRVGYWTVLLTRHLFQYFVNCHGIGNTYITMCEWSNVIICSLEVHYEENSFLFLCFTCIYHIWLHLRIKKINNYYIMHNTVWQYVLF